jgi:reductive dehalogenase
MKVLGVIGAGVGASAAAVPVFHDMDEVIASPKSNWERPWWVKERNFGETTQEMDWKLYDAFDYDANGAGAALTQKIGVEAKNKLFKDDATRIAQFMINKTPGRTIRDRAMRDALVRGDALQGLADKFGFPGDRLSATPKQRGERATPPVVVPRWDGTPEENARMMRSVLCFRGAALVGFTELDEKSRRFIYKKRGGKTQVFENVEDPYATSDKLVTPEKCRWAISFAVPRCEETWRRGPSHISDAGEMIGYSYGRIVWTGAVEFLNAIGYMGLGSYGNGYKLNPPFAMWTGIGEPTRIHNSAISPELGDGMGTFVIITDLPLAPTPPIDAGIFKYCHTCKKCAQTCPSKALSTDDEPTWETRFGASNMTGQKAFPFSFPTCMEYWYTDSSYCAQCIRSCPFAHKILGTVHDVISSTIATTPVFNGFFRKMDDFFGYGTQADPESWWDLPPKMHGLWNMQL